MAGDGLGEDPMGRRVHVTVVVVDGVEAMLLYQCAADGDQVEAAGHLVLC